jgi:recombinational DNA repair protein RecR
MSAKSQPKPKKEKAEGNKTFVKENVDSIWTLQSLIANCEICTLAESMKICGVCQFEEGMQIYAIVRDTRNLFAQNAPNDQIEYYWRTMVKPHIFQKAINMGVMDEFMVEV